MPESTRADNGLSSPRLIVVSGMMLGLQIALHEDPVVIGRSSESGLALPHPSVSRQHCRIWREDNRFLIEDLGSTNRTFLNGKAITSAELRDGDQIMVGNNAIKFFVGVSKEAEYHHELIDLAIYDSLTGFFNRRHFRSLLDEEVERARNGSALNLLMLDLDHFKQVNDQFGHLVGDQVLAGVAQVIRENAPPGVPIGRLGGEEFALAWPEQTLRNARNLAEILRAAVAARPIGTREQQLAVTISVGVSRTDSKIDDSAALLRCADEQLYLAKQGGRNRVSSVD
ncbi:MAG: GGDEF domain-containing protein [Rudaea sp.]